MTNIDSPPRRRSVLVPVLGALAVVAAGAVLYGTVAPAGKAASDCPADSAKLAARLAPLAKGELAALQVASEPRRAIQVAFERDDGGKLTLADFKGRAVLLNLWATWCIPCRAEMPALDRLQAAKGGPGFEVVAVNVDTAKLETPGGLPGQRRREVADALRRSERRRLRDPAQGRQGARTAGDSGHRQGRLRSRPPSRAAPNGIRPKRRRWSRR